MNSSIIIYIIIVINILCLLAGILLGKIIFFHNIVPNQQKTQSTFSKNKSSTSNNSSVNIDSTKYVVPIKTDTLEKKYDTLGETKSSQENISSSVERLKGLKK